MDLNSRLTLIVRYQQAFRDNEITYLAYSVHLVNCNHEHEYELSLQLPKEVSVPVAFLSYPCIDGSFTDAEVFNSPVDGTMKPEELMEVIMSVVRDATDTLIKLPIGPTEIFP